MQAITTTVSRMISRGFLPLIGMAVAILVGGHFKVLLAEETAKREEERKASAKSVVVRKKSPNTIINK